MATNQNCWEYVNCGKEKECPAYPDNGKMCYSVAATLCRGEIQGAYKDKAQACRTICEYYKRLFS